MNEKNQNDHSGDQNYKNQLEVDNSSLGERRDDVNLLSSKYSSKVTKNHTYIDFKDAESPTWDIEGWPRKYKRFELYNRGIWNGNWGNQEMLRNRSDRQFCRDIASQLDLLEWEKKRLWQIFKPLDMGSYKKYEFTPEISTIRRNRSGEGGVAIWHIRPSMRKQFVVIFSICALIYNQRMSNDKYKFYPGKTIKKRTPSVINSADKENLDKAELKEGAELFEEFADQLSFRDEAIRSCMEKLRQECPRLD